MPAPSPRDIPAMRKNFFKKGQRNDTHPNHTYKKRGTKTLLKRVREILNMRRTDGGKGTRFDAAADAFARAMEAGSFIHTKEYIDREEGKVPNRIAGADGEGIKFYVGMPIDNDPNAP